MNFIRQSFYFERKPSNSLLVLASIVIYYPASWFPLQLVAKGCAFSLVIFPAFFVRHDFCETEVRGGHKCLDGGERCQLLFQLGNFLGIRFCRIRRKNFSPIARPYLRGVDFPFYALLPIEGVGNEVVFIFLAWSSFCCHADCENNLRSMKMLLEHTQRKLSISGDVGKLPCRIG